MPDVTKNPRFTTDQQLAEENERRKNSINEILRTKDANAIRSLIECQLDASIGRAMTPPKGEVLYILEVDYLVPEREFGEYLRLVELRNMAYGGGLGTSPDQKAIDEYKKKIKEITQRGSDAIRAAVTNAANWACIPPEMLAAVLQNENSPAASNLQRHGQAAERNLQSIIGKGSTGFGNVKPETLSGVKSLVETYYKRSILGEGVKNVGQNKNIETDIFETAAVLREGLNQAWSAGERSLNQNENKRYNYYPYFGGAVSEDAAIRAMGHYNGWGDGALAYGRAAYKRMTRDKLYFLEAR